MSALNEFEQIPRKVMTLFFLVDKSGSMSGTKINELNVAIREVIPIVADIAANNSDAEIKIAALEYSTTAEWMFAEPKKAEEFQWCDIQAGGLTSMGAAYKTLEEKLHKTGFMRAASGSFAPVFIHFSDGEPTDNYNQELQKLKANNWFKAGVKVAIAIGNDADKEILKEFTGSSESVLTVHNKEDLKELIKFVTVTSSQIATSTGSKTGGERGKQGDVEKAIGEQFDGDDNKIEIGTAPDPNAASWGDEWN